MKNSRKKNSKASLVARCGIAVGLAYVLSNFKLFTMPEGGSVTFVSLPLILLSVTSGAPAGAAAGITLGILKIFTGGKIFGWVQAALDYPLAYSALSFSGLAMDRGNIPVLLFAFAALILKFLIHLFSGYLFFQKSLYASMIYNAAFSAPEAAISILALHYALKKRLIEKITLN